jgi:two-component system, NarL family, nitrate/nitrite response regulator NarL
MSQKIKLIIIDDTRLFLEAAAEVLARDPDIQILAVGETAKDAIRLTKLYHPDILLLDLKIPGGGLSSAWVLSSTFPATRIIALTSSEAEDDILEAARAGVCAYVLKGVSGSDLIDKIHKVYTGECIRLLSMENHSKN